MFQTVRFSDGNHTVDAQAIVIDGMIFLFDAMCGVLCHALCYKSIEKYGLSLSQFQAILHLHGAKKAIQLYPKAFIVLGQNQFVHTQISRRNLLVHEN